MLEQLGLPLLAAERRDGDPLVFGGGPVLTANPEPYADFFDVVLLGGWCWGLFSGFCWEGELSLCALLLPPRRCATAGRPAAENPRACPPGACRPAGDGEELLAAFTEALQEAKRRLAPPRGGPAPRAELLLALAQVPGVYVPQASNPAILASAPAGGLS